MKLILLIMLFMINVRADALLDYMSENWLDPIVKEEPESNYEPTEEFSDYSESEAEIHHWQLGTPDNIPETIIIYSDEPSPCEL